MYTLNKIHKKIKPINKPTVFILSLFITITLIILAVKFTLNFRPLYKFDLNYLKISESTGISEKEILDNYNTLIDYLSPSYKGSLSFPTLPMSKEGKIHFEDVKGIFTFINNILYPALIVSLIGIFYSFKKRDYSLFKWSSFTNILLPIALAIPFAISFDKTFDTFHALAFSNDYWLFDPKKDPIINLLPEEFFMHSAILILVLLTLSSVILFLIYRLLKGNKN